MFSSPNSRSETVLNTDKLHVKLKDTSFVTIRDSCFQFILSTISQGAKRKYTNTLILPKLCLNPYQEQINCMSNGNTRISSLA